MRRSTPLLLALIAPLLLALSPGDTAPDFTLANQDGKPVSLAQFVGKPVLLYFYPKDDTPGCTKQACDLRDNYAKYTAKGAVILGISRQDAKSHREFRRKHKLPFDLLVDGDGKVARSYGVGTMGGSDLFERKSVLVGPDGKVFRYYASVNPAEHAQNVLNDLNQLKR